MLQVASVPAGNFQIRCAAQTCSSIDSFGLCVWIFRSCCAVVEGWWCRHFGQHLQDAGFPTMWYTWRCLHANVSC